MVNGANKADKLATHTVFAYRQAWLEVFSHEFRALVGSPELFFRVLQCVPTDPDGRPAPTTRVFCALRWSADKDCWDETALGAVEVGSNKVYLEKGGLYPAEILSEEPNVVWEEMCSLPSVSSPEPSSDRHRFSLFETYVKLKADFEKGGGDGTCPEPAELWETKRFDEKSWILSVHFQRIRDKRFEIGLFLAEDFFRFKLWSGAMSGLACILADARRRIGFSAVYFIGQEGGVQEYRTGFEPRIPASVIGAAEILGLKLANESFISDSEGKLLLEKIERYSGSAPKYFPADNGYSWYPPYEANLLRRPWGKLGLARLRSG